MTDAHAIRSLFDSGDLVSPAAPGPTTVDLTRAIFDLAGAPDLDLSPQAVELWDEIGAADHLVFVIIDALGSALLERHSPKGQLAKHHRRDLRAIFPSTTAAALTSFATGEYPAVHGVTGWWMHLVEHGITVTSLRFVERFSERPLGEFGIAPETVFPTEPLTPRLPRATLIVTPDPFQHDVYVGYTSGGTPAAGYSDPGDAVERVIRHVNDAHGPTYTSVYFPQVDEAGHIAGVDSEEIGSLIGLMDDLIAVLAAALKDKARIVVTADHGQVALPRANALVLADGDPLLGMLACPPAGEPVIPTFFLRDTTPEEFRAAFQDRFGEAFHLITPSEAEELALFGPGPLSRPTRRRLGDLIGVPGRPTALYYQPEGRTVEPHRGVHAGLTRHEMMVPLILF